MRKLLRKKINLFGKEISVFLIAIVGVIALVSAALVPYLSNTVFGTVEVSSPLTLEITGASDNVEIISPTEFSASLFGGEFFFIDSLLTVNSQNVSVTGHIGEIKIIDFDGEGVTVTYEDDFTDPIEILGCQGEEDDNFYYYIGNPEDELPPGLELLMTTTFESALNLEPRVYELENRVIVVEARACTF